MHILAQLAQEQRVKIYRQKYNLERTQHNMKDKGKN